MNILIVENEIYLAQSIASKLTEIGHHCEIAPTIKDALKEEQYDAILLSTNISGQNFHPVIDRYKNSIIILMISYISNDTVTNPIKSGADDYIQKPFMIEELIRKLHHLSLFQTMQQENIMYKAYLQHYLEEPVKTLPQKTKLPLLVRSSFQKSADFLVFTYAKQNNETFTFISLSNSNAIDKILKAPENALLYIVDLQNIKKNDKLKIFEFVAKKRAIISSTDLDENYDAIIEEIQIINEDKIFDKGDIMSIDNYVKHIILNFQNTFPDTELSKKLGISRKSLWEKRKKYDIAKKK
ncbi:MAG: response regulator [Sulfurospirillum sp.]|nr:response regulator [Sulfurospirillum sp.]